jgi:hypothetical protein
VEPFLLLIFLQEAKCLPSGAAVRPFLWRVGMNNIFYIIGVVVVVALVLGYLGLA